MSALTSWLLQYKFVATPLPIDTVVSSYEHGNYQRQKCVHGEQVCMKFGIAVGRNGYNQITITKVIEGASNAHQMQFGGDRGLKRIRRIAK